MGREALCKQCQTSWLDKGWQERCSCSHRTMVVEDPFRAGPYACRLSLKCMPQVAHKIYAKPMSLPDFILERGRSSGGDLRRLRDMFLKLDAGMSCSPSHLLLLTWPDCLLSQCNPVMWPIL